jgi:hypothetical protein
MNTARLDQVWNLNSTPSLATSIMAWALVLSQIREVVIPLSLVIMDAAFPKVKVIAETSFAPVIPYRSYLFPGQLTGKEMTRSMLVYCFDKGIQV